MLIGESSAEEIKIKIASAYPMDPEQQIEVKGRDLVTGIPQNIIITSEEVRKAISEQVEASSRPCAHRLEQTLRNLPILWIAALSSPAARAAQGVDQLLREETSCHHRGGRSVVHGRYGHRPRA